jgi:hypothetical protein
MYRTWSYYIYLYTPDPETSLVLPVERDGRGALEGALGEDGGAADRLLSKTNERASGGVATIGPWPCRYANSVALQPRASPPKSHRSVAVVARHGSFCSGAPI